MSYISQT